MLDIRPTYEESIELEAEIDAGEFVDEIAQIISFYAESERVVLSAEEIAAYIRGMIWMRVSYVNRSLPPDFRDVYERPWVLPVLVAQLCAQIGKATDVETRSIVIWPITKLPVPDLDLLIRVSQKLRLLGGRGLPIAQELPRSREGSYDFMTMTVVNDVIRARDVSVPPVHAFLCAITRNRLIEDCFSPRVSYGSTKRYRVFLERFVAGLPDEALRATPRSGGATEGAEGGPNTTRPVGSPAATGSTDGKRPAHRT